MGLFAPAVVVLRVFLCLLRAIVAADYGLPAANCYLDTAIVDFPVAHGAFHGLHRISFQTAMDKRLALTFAGDVDEDILARPKKSGFQNLAHFAKGPASGGMSHLRGSATKLTAEGISEMAVAGEAEVQSQAGEISCAVG